MFRHISKEWLALTIIAILILIIAILDWNKKPTGQNATTQPPIRIEKEAGDVTVLVEYLPEQSDNKVIAFKITLDTHSVNLDAFDFQKDIVLEKSSSKDASLVVINQSGSVHHRSAQITFPATTFPFAMVVNNLSGVKRREFIFEKL